MLLIGFVVGSNGRIIKTTDGGSNWNTQALDSNITLTGVYILDANTGWIVGDILITAPYWHWDGIIRKTTNGGQTWITQTSPINTENEFLNKLHFADANTGWIVGRSMEGAILKTTNGGTTWVCQSTGIGWEPLRGIFFTDLNNEYNIIDFEPSQTLTAGTLTCTVVGNPFSSETESTRTLLIKPNKIKTEQIFKEDFDYVEQFLLNRNTLPLYTSQFSYPDYDSNGVCTQYVDNLTWATDGFCNLDIRSSLFDNYLDKLQNASQ